ncbi:hypothetical protein [Actinoplanes sp. DH11]|uniref:hypothetical protein n=1 Tax=Actinoplanes sp. DH11 TaxID=2857011 RepID=UPI001E3A0265|nr:hypothetical protein [Actinoplanes sp. DH11]
MARQVRYRVAAVVLSGLIFGAPLLANGTASAEQLDPGDRRVSFTGTGVLGLTCESRPTVESMTVPADSVIQVRNRTGHDAQLKLGGAPKGVIPENGSADLVFRRGTTSVVLTPDCDNGQGVVPMIVTASPSAAAGRPDPAPATPGGNAATLSKPARPGAPARTTAKSTRAGAASDASRTTRTGPKSVRPGNREPSGARPAVAASRAATAGQSGTDQRVKAKAPAQGTGGVGAPTFAGMPLGDRQRLVPSSAAAGAPVTAAASAPAAGPAETPLGDEDAGVPVQGVEEPSNSPGTEPVAAVGPIREGRPIGLLGLTALTCVLGVSIAAIRAIVSQRASRANMS